MNHIQRCHSPRRPTLQVPLLCEDITAIDRVAIRQSFEYLSDEDDFIAKRIDSDILPHTLSFLQSWLWFETLEEIFKIVSVEYDPSDFVTESSLYRGRISTVKLPQYIYY